MRGRGNGGGGRRNGPPRSQHFESNGPDVKVRGNAQQVVEKYLALAREAATAGDPVMAENYYQHAEHYFRIQYAGDRPRPQMPGPSGDGSADGDMDEADGAMAPREIRGQHGDVSPRSPAQVASADGAGEPQNT